jgi:hypothetical protein
VAISKGKADGGQGGKRGHSNMDHWEFTEEIKLAAKKRRRLAAKTEIKLASMEFESEDSNNTQRRQADE